MYTIGYVRDPLVQLSNLRGANSMRPPYYLTRYGSVPGMVGPSRTPRAAALMWPSTGRGASRRLPEHLGTCDQFRRQANFGRAGRYTTKR